MDEHKSHTKSTSAVKRLVGVLILVLLAVVGCYLINLRVAWVDQRMRKDLLKSALSISQTIETNLVSDLTFTPKDKESPSFQLIVNQEKLYGAFGGFKSIYSMALQDGKIVFGPENIPEGDPLASPPGTVYEKPRPQDWEALRTGVPYTVGPVTDEYGSFISAGAPVIDLRTGKILFILGMDIKAEEWQTAINVQRGLSYGVLAVVLLLAFILLVSILRHEASRSAESGIIFTLVLMGVVVTAGTVFLIYENRLTSQQDVFNQVALQKLSLLRRSLTETKSDLVHVGDFFQKDAALSNPGAFAEFSRNILNNYTIASCGFVRRVKHEDRAAFESGQGPDYRISVKGPDGTRTPQTVQSEYFPFYIAEPMEEMQKAIGVDVLSTPQRKEAIRDAIFYNKPIASAPLVRISTGETAVSAYLPVYEGPDRNLKGMAFITYRPAEMLKALNRDASIVGDLKEDLFELRADKKPVWIASSYTSVPTGTEVENIRLKDAWAEYYPLMVLGRTYVLRIHMIHHGGVPLFVETGIPFVLLMLLTFLIAYLFHARFSLEKIVNVRTGDLKRANEFQELVLNNVGSAIITLDEYGTVVSLNKTAETMLGYAREDVVGKANPLLWHDPAQVEQRIKESAAELGEQPRQGLEGFLLKARRSMSDVYETTFVRKDGSRVQVLVAICAYKDEKGLLLGYLKVATDITRYKLMQKELEHQKYALDQVAIVGITDVHGRITYANDNFCKVSKFSREELLGQDHRIMNSGHHSKEYFRGMWETIAGGRIWVGETKNKAKDGTMFWLDTRIIPFVDAQGKVFQYMAIRRDITESVEIREEMLRKNEQLQAANKAALAAGEAKSAFLANMSHEIRTPMNAILGFSDLLGKTELNGKQKRYLDLISSSGELLLGIINDILDISKLDSGKVRFESIDCDLRKLVFDVMKMIVTRMKNRPFDTYVDIKEDVPAVVKTDPLRLKQVLVNLVGNAIKFTSKGEIGVTIEKIAAGPGSYQLRFTVKDTGIGIAKEKQDKLFKSFSQADESTTREYGGTGLGLAISKSIVEGLGGAISVRSEENKGAEFIFDLIVGASSAKAEDAEALRDAGYFKNKTVFIVDDNLMSQKIIGKCCQTLNLQILGVSTSPQEALHRLDRIVETRDIVPDIILSDIMMEGMSGFEMAAKIKANERFKHTIFIAITADLHAEADYDPSRKVFNAFVTKPVSVDTLSHALCGLIAQSERPDVDAVHKSCSGIRVLMAEDVLANQILMEEYFEQLGCTADIVNNGQEAVNKLRGPHAYDLCLMDIQMPVMDGISAIKMIRAEISKDFPVIALSAAVLQEEQEAARAAGMSDFLMKPVDVQKLEEKILLYAKLKKGRSL